MISHHAQLADLRMQNLIRAVQSIMVFTAAIIANAFLPQIIITYMYTQEQLLTLTEQPRILELLPLITFGLAAAYFVYTVIANVMNNRKAAVISQEIAVGGCCGDSCCSDDGSEELSESELQELESIVEEALTPKKSAKSAKKTAKKTSKK